jgi:biotin carboxyl carrier protein
MKYKTTVNGKTFDIDINAEGELRVNGELRHADFVPLGDTLFSVIRETLSHELIIEPLNSRELDIVMNGRQYQVNVLDERAMLMGIRKGDAASEGGEISVKAPMPGLIVAVTVEEGHEVTRGQTVVILESMKMQNELKSPRDGVVQRISVKAGETVEQNKILITLT